MKVYKAKGFEHYSIYVEGNNAFSCYSDTGDVLLPSNGKDLAVYITFSEKMKNSVELVPEYRYIPPIAALRSIAFATNRVSKLVYYIDGEGKASVFTVQIGEDAVYAVHSVERVEEVEEVDGCSVPTNRCIADELRSGNPLIGLLPALDKEILGIPPEYGDDIAFAFGLDVVMVKWLYSIIADKGKVKVADIASAIIASGLINAGRQAYRIGGGWEVPENLTTCCGKISPLYVFMALDASGKAVDYVKPAARAVLSAFRKFSNALAKCGDDS